MPAKWQLTIEDLADERFDLNFQFPTGPKKGVGFERLLPVNQFQINLDGIAQSNRRFSPGDVPKVEVENKAQTITLDHLQQVGTQLYKELFRGSGEEFFHTVYQSHRLSPPDLAADILEDEKFLNLWIDASKAGQLVGVPWEVLYETDRDIFLATDRGCNIIRKLDPVRSEGNPADVGDKIKVLVAIANPAEDLDDETEFANIDRQLTKLMDNAEQSLEVYAIEKTTYRALRMKIDEWKPHVVHFIGHGDFRDGGGIISLHGEKAENPIDSVDAQRLKQLMLNHKPWMVVLNSCLGGVSSRFNPFAGAAQALRQIDVPFVVAMQYSISDDAAICFSETFYGALAMGMPVAPAVSSARSALRGHEDPLARVELITPVLYASEDQLRIPLPPPVFVPVGDGDAGSDQANDAVEPDGGRRGPRWWEVAGLLATVIGAGAGVLTYVSSLGSGVGEPAQQQPPDDGQGGTNGGGDTGGGDTGAGGGGSVSDGNGPGNGASDGGSFAGGGDTGAYVGPIRGPANSTEFYYCPTAEGDPADENCPEEAPPLGGDVNPLDPLEPSLPQIDIPPPPPPPPLLSCSEGVYRIFFGHDSDLLDEDARWQIDAAISNRANCYGNDTFHLRGHDDRWGDDDYSRRISEDRNAAVRAYLISRGVAPSQITVEPLGETEPLVPTADGVRERLNRRVEITSSQVSAPLSEEAMGEIRSQYASLLVKTLRSSGLLSEVRNVGDAELTTPVIDQELVQERAALRRRIREALEAGQGDLSDEEYSAQKEELRELREKLLSDESAAASRTTQARIYASRLEAISRQYKELNDFLERDRRRRKPLLDEEEREEIELELAFVSVMLSSFPAYDPNELEAQNQSLSELLEKLEEALEVYEEAAAQSAARLRQDFRLIGSAVADSDALYLEIISPYQRPQDQEFAKCLGERLRNSLYLTDATIESERSDEGSDETYGTFTYRFESAYECGVEPSPEEQEEREELRESLEELADEGEIPLFDRIQVRTQQRRFGFPETGDVPLGAHREVRVRFEGTERLVLDPESPDLTPLAEGKIAALIDRVEAYNTAAISALQARDCEDEDALDDEQFEECERTPTPTLSLVVEAALDPRVSQEQAALRAGVRLNSVLTALRKRISADLAVKAVVCKTPWYEGGDYSDVVNLSVMPEGVEEALDYCSFEQEINIEIEAEVGQS